LDIDHFFLPDNNTDEENRIIDKRASTITDNHIPAEEHFNLSNNNFYKER
jgi:hypothetical protein